MRNQSDTVVAKLAARQHGVVTREQLLAAGVSKTGIHRRVERASLHPVLPGVYRVGHKAPNVEATYLAAVLACGEGAVLSGLAAAHLHRLTKGRAPRPEVCGKRRRSGVSAHRTAVDPRDTTTVRGIPVMTVARVLVDIAPRLTPDALARACHEAGVQYRTTPRHVDTVLRRRPNAPGAAKLRAVMAGETRVTLSKLERAFLDLVERHRLPLPQTNMRAGTYRVDCRWPEHRLAVELDSYRYHHTRQAWERDRRREREAHARGDAFRRYTWDDVTGDPRALLAELHAVLVSGNPAATLSVASARSSAG